MALDTVSAVDGQVIQENILAHSVTLSWTASPDVTSGAGDGYNVYRSAVSGTYSPPLNSAPLTTTTFTDTSVTTAGKYFYVATAIESGQESVHSNEVSAVILPAAPTALAVTSIV